VGFRGYKGINGLVRRLEKTVPEARPHGALVIESGAFVGVTGCAIREEGVYRLIAELTEVFNSAVGVAYPKFTNYVETHLTSRSTGPATPAASAPAGVGSARPGTRRSGRRGRR
jgi:hypothetical protein